MNHSSDVLVQEAEIVHNFRHTHEVLLTGGRKTDVFIFKFYKTNRNDNGGTAQMAYWLFLILEQTYTFYSK